MRKLTGAVFTSLDGVMQAPGGKEEDPTCDFRHGGWVQPLWGADMGPFEAVIMGEYDLLLGKRTYDIFAAYWPYNQDDPIGEKFQRILLAVQPGRSDRREIPAHRQICADPFGQTAGVGEQPSAVWRHR